MRHPSLPLSCRMSPCDVCEHDEFELLSERDRKAKPLNTVVCRNCGLVSHERIPTESELLEYYEKTYRQDYHGEYRPSARRVLREWRRGEDIAQRLVPYLKSKDRIYEIGAGLGGNVKQLEVRGFDASGMEPGAGFQQFAENQLKARVSRGWLFGDSRPQGGFDVVLLIHVLEHLRSPKEALQLIHRMLVPGGRLYVEVPNFEAPHATPAKLFHYAHIYNFTRSTIAMLGKLTGFRVRHAFSSVHDKSLSVLLERVDTKFLAVDPQGYSTSIEAYARYNTFTYHARWNYVRARLRTLYRQHAARFFARRRLRQLLHQCAENSPAPAEFSRAA